jgi:hypothetical protein
MEQVESRALGAVQRRLWRLITDPSGVEDARSGEGDARGMELAALVRDDRGIAATDRLSVYANAYFARIHDCLREDFPALARALGPAAFHDLVKTYLMMHPPTRPSLRHAGRHLAEHLSAQPFAEIFSRRCPYAADLARLEWAMLEAFFAPDAAILERESLAALAPEAWAGLRFETTPSLELLTCDWPVQTVRERLDAEDPEAAWEEPPALAAEATYVRVWRVAERVRSRAVARHELEALAAARAGEPFAAICDLLASAVGEAEAAPEAAVLLASWLSAGLLARGL